jgi:nitroreductase
MTAAPRTAAHPIAPMFLSRHSPRAMSGAPIDRATMATLLEAARWAPSSGNGQPWRFVYAYAGTPEFKALFDALMPGNQVWCARAGALVVAATKAMNDKGEPVRTAPFDAGAAWMSLALQAQELGLVAHGMAGFDVARATAVVAPAKDVEVIAMIALGHPGNVDDLPEHLRSREALSGRNSQEEWAFEGAFPKG